MFTFYIQNHEPFGSLTKSCPKLEKNKSILSRFSVFVVYKLVVSIFFSVCLYLRIYLTDIPRQREEYEVPYHFYSSSWSGISVLFYDKLTLHFCHKIKQSYPNPTRRGLSGQSPT